MTLAGNQNHVTGHGLDQRQPDSFFALRLDLMPCAGLPQAGQRVIDNLQRIFTPRIVRGKNNEVASLARRLTPSADAWSDHGLRHSRIR